MRLIIAQVFICASLLGAGNSVGPQATINHPYVAATLMAIAAVLSVGLSGGQAMRCLRRKSSEDVSIGGWLSGAASNAFVLGAALITHEWWWAVWQGLGVVEYATPAAIAWWYRSPRRAAFAVTAPPFNSSQGSPQ